MTVEACFDLNPAGPVDGRDQHPQRANVLVGIAGETLDGQVDDSPVRRTPAHVPPQNGAPQIEIAPEVNRMPLIQPERIAVNPERQVKPVRQISQFGERDRHVVKNAMSHRQGMIIRVAFLEAPPAAKVAVADGEHRFHVMLAFRLKTRLHNGPGGVRAGGCLQVLKLNGEQIIPPDDRPKAALDVGESLFRAERQAGHPGNQGSLDTGCCILNHHALERHAIQHRCRATEQIRERFLARHAVAIDQDAQSVPQAQAINDHAGVAARRDNGVGNGSCVQAAEQRRRTG